MRKVEIKVATPCSEKWETFEKRGLNGYCNSCEKEVVDFTKMSDLQIKNYFKKAKGDVCGQMYSRQQKVYADTSKLTLKPLASALMTGAALLFTGTSTLAQSKDPTEQTEQKGRKGKAKKDIEDKSEEEKRTINGRVTDESGESLPGVNVKIKGTKIGTTSDLDGNYRLTAVPSDILVFTFYNSDPIEESVGARSTIDVSMKVLFNLDAIVVGGIHYRWQPLRSLWWRTKSLFRRNY
jgi:hypothetical protein